MFTNPALLANPTTLKQYYDEYLNYATIINKLGARAHTCCAQGHPPAECIISMYIFVTLCLYCPVMIFYAYSFLSAAMSLKNIYDRLFIGLNIVLYFAQIFVMTMSPALLNEEVRARACTHTHTHTRAVEHGVHMECERDDRASCKQLHESCANVVVDVSQFAPCVHIGRRHGGYQSVVTTFAYVLCRNLLDYFDETGQMKRFSRVALRSRISRVDEPIRKRTHFILASRSSSTFTYRKHLADTLPYILLALFSRLKDFSVMKTLLSEVKRILTALITQLRP
jgi:hypothetical protein